MIKVTAEGVCFYLLREHAAAREEYIYAWMILIAFMICIYGDAYMLEGGLPREIWGWRWCWSWIRDIKHTIDLLLFYNSVL